MSNFGLNNKPIVFFGTEEFSLISLKALVEANFNVVAVVTKPDSRKGRGQKIIEPSVKIFAQQHNIPVWQPTSLREIEPSIQELDHPVGVLVSYGKIIPQSIIDLFTPGIINVHPSLLPLYRGPSPIESAIKNGDSLTGVSIMQLSSKMDAGPVYKSTTVKLLGNETKPELYSSLGTIGSELLITLLPQIMSGDLQPAQQDDSAATYCKLLNKSDSFLDTQKFTAIEAERLVRAHLGFPKTKISILENTIIITRASIADKKETPLDIEFYDGSILRVEQLIAPSGKTMDSDSFIRGYSII